MFDKFTKNYNEILNKSIEVTGCNTSDLINAKLLKLRDINPSLINKTINFLDYGCGTGNLCENFHYYFPKAHFFGVDISSEMVNEARKKYHSRGTFYEINSLEWKNKSYDLIFSAGVFHHILPQFQSDIIKKLSNLMSDSGRLIIWEHNPFNPVTRKIVKECPFDKDAILISPKKIKNLLIQNSLYSVKIIYTSFFPKYLNFLFYLERYLEHFPLGAQYVVIGNKEPIDKISHPNTLLLM